MAALREIVFDCESAPALARFWAAVLNAYAIRSYDAAELQRLASLGLTPENDPTVLVDGPGPSLCFQQVDEPKVGKNRVHIDVEASTTLAAEVDRLRALGATVSYEAGEWTTMLDPEGNEFCVVRAVSAESSH